MRLLRLLQVLWVIDRYRLDRFLPKRLPLKIRMLLWPNFWRHFIRPPKDPATGLRLALEDLGPVFVKFGQMLSTRRDLLPLNIANELARLQDQVPPFSGELAQAIIEKSLGKPIEQVYDNFDRKPLASASVAQVHPAQLKNGQKVVVKVIRPGIDRIIEKDLALLRILAQLIQLIPDGRRLRPVEVVEEYRKTILGELDLLAEGANAATLRRNFQDSAMLYVPEIYWDFSRTSVLTMERIYGIPVSGIDELKAQNTNMKLLAERGVEIFFTQVFRDSFFHADMHPGNVFVSREHPDSPQFIGIDCGIVGSLSEADLNYLALTLLAFFRRDYRAVAQLYVDSGWVPETTRVHEFEGAIRTVCEPIFEKPLSEISFGVVLIRLFQTARQFNMEVQPQLVLLQKTLLNIEGLGRELYPELNLWETAKPFLEKWLRDRYSPKRALREIMQRAPSWLEKAPQMPDMIYHVLNSGQLSLNQQGNYQQQIIELKAEMNYRNFAQQWRWLANILLIGAGVAWFGFGNQPLTAISAMAAVIAALISFRRKKHG
ncbi:ubiquinone biosynthesis regulatory protein kinase UbiB [Gynuella sp.]|uniref:ubiquinone biosynthesis regulatory protein kinase UbiB n=1 Tax=Gynuella sp. TaxID=2969146 RepID=UPI003D1060F3